MTLYRLLLIGLVLGFIHTALATVPTDSTIVGQPSGPSPAYVTDVVPITFYLPTGTVSSFTCPSSAISSTPLMTSSSQPIYDESLVAHYSYSGYTCSIMVPHYATVTAAAYLTSLGVPASAPGASCPSTLYLAPANMYCYQGLLTDINTYTANTSICFTDLTGTSGCAGVPQSGQWYYAGVYYAFNGAASTGTYISNGTTNVSVPACSAGNPLLMYLTTNKNYDFAYNTNVTFEQSYDGYCYSGPNSCTCWTHHSIAGNSPANSACSATAMPFQMGYKNQISVSTNLPASNFITNAPWYPFTWLSGNACVVGSTTQSSPITP